MTKRILLVDDDANVLQGFRRHLRKDYDIELAIGGREAIEILTTKGPFAVVVSDMQMPQMSGVELLREVRQLSEHTVRIMLTGNADQRTAVEAVNEGHIFRFLNKPCPPEQLASALDAGLRQYQLVTAEAELLNKTLSGSVRMLTQILSLAMPDAFGLTQEARTLARTIATKLGVGPIWQIEMAAMLMRVGCVSLPGDVLHRYLSDGPLSVEEMRMVDDTPKLGHSLLVAIPRLEGVANLILGQNDPPRGDTPIASRILRAIGDFQRFRQNQGPFAALNRLDIATIYDADVVEALTEEVNAASESREIRIGELREGMILESNVEDRSGRLLLVAGTEVHESMIHKLAMLRRSGTGVREPILVRIASSTTVQTAVPCPIN